MSNRKKKQNPFAAILIGPAIGFVAVMALWHNEGRFDYYRAAKATTPIEALGAEGEGSTVSITGSMDQDLVMTGDYVESFQGYLTVRRSAEIYSWEEDEDSEGNVTWSIGWHSYLESNSRNSGVVQQLDSRTIQLDEYMVGDWNVDGDRLDFIDSRESIPPSELTLSVDGRELELRPEAEYFFLRKGAPKELGDERVSYSGIPAPATATYFGLLQADRGVPHVAEVKTGWVDALIGDTGLLHHLSAGDREVALQAMKADLARVKWLVRILGTLGTIIAYLIFFSGFFRFLMYVPLIGRIAELGILLASLALGLVTAFLTIVTSYVIHHPLILVVILMAVVALVLYSRRRGRRVQAGAREALAREIGHPLSERELAERQFVGMARVAMADPTLDKKEEKFLHKWAGQRGLSEDDVARLLASAEQDTAEQGFGREQNLAMLIQLALADGDVSAYELKKLFQAGKQLGHSPKEVRMMVADASRPIPPVPPAPPPVPPAPA